MASVNPVLQGLHRALRIHTAEGDVMMNPADDPEGYGALLGRSRDARVGEARQAEDAAPPDPMTDPAQTAYFKTFNRGQEDAAMGPSGYNREWAALLEAPDVLQENDPTRKYRYNYSTMGNPANQLAGLSRTRKPMPQSQDDFVASVPGLQKRLGR